MAASSNQVAAPLWSYVPVMNAIAVAPTLGGLRVGTSVRVRGSVEQSEDGDHGGRPGLGGSRVYKGAPSGVGTTEITVS